MIPFSHATLQKHRIHCEHATVRRVVIDKVSFFEQRRIVQMIDFDLGIFR